MLVGAEGGSLRMDPCTISNLKGRASNSSSISLSCLFLHFSPDRDIILLLYIVGEIELVESVERHKLLVGLMKHGMRLCKTKSPVKVSTYSGREVVRETGRGDMSLFPLSVYSRIEPMFEVGGIGFGHQLSVRWVIDSAEEGCVETVVVERASTYMWRETPLERRGR